MSILPFYWRWAALAALCAAVALYTGIKVANHYRGQLDTIYAEGRVQKAHVAQVEVKQREVTKNVQKSTVAAIAASDAFYLKLQHADPGAVSVFAGPASGTTEAAQAVAPYTRCDPADGAADAEVIVAWQTFYRDLQAAQK